MADSGIVHVVTGVPVLLSQYESQAHHALSSGTSFPASPVEKQLFYRTDLHKLYIYNGSSWVDTSLGADFTAHASRHQDGGADEISIAALSGEPAELTIHKGLTTGVHGAGSNHLALFNAASTVVSRFVWKDTSERALADLNRTTQLTYTDLDLTAYTSATAKLVLLQVTLYLVAYTSGRIVCELRKNGTTPGYAPTLEAALLAAGGYNCFTFIVGLDSGQVMEYQLTPTGTAQFSTFMDVLGYIE